MSAYALGGGVTHVSEAHHTGWAAIIAAEVDYPIARQWAAKLEASYLIGVGELDELRAPVAQAGILYKF